MAERKYRLAAGAQQTLSAVIATVPPLVDQWKAQIDSGEIDEQLRSVCVSFGWITQRDSRVTPVTQPARPKDPIKADTSGTSPLRQRKAPNLSVPPPWETEVAEPVPEVG